MKNLLFLINISVFCTMIFACTNLKNNDKTELQKEEEKEKIEAQAQSMDTTKNIENTQLSGETIDNQDSLSKSDKYSSKEDAEVQEAPPHNSPNQSKIDSIKKAKGELKK